MVFPDLTREGRMHSLHLVFHQVLSSRLLSRSGTNMIKPLFALVFFLTAAVLTATAIDTTSPRVKYNFNSDWRLYVGDVRGAESVSFDDAAWKRVTTPHAWNEDDAFRNDIKDLSTGIAWYRKHFIIPAGNEDKKVFIE